jgi:hypothetical protein
VTINDNQILYNKTLEKPRIESITTRNDIEIIIPQSLISDEFILEKANQNIYNKKLYDCILDNVISIDSYVSSSITFPSQ